LVLEKLLGNDWQKLPLCFLLLNSSKKGPRLAQISDNGSKACRLAIGALYLELAEFREASADDCKIVHAIALRITPEKW
jgi:hypothetical protein